MSFERVEYRRLYEDVIEQIETMIATGKLCPGDRLPPERELAEQIGISRGTLREAFRILERQGAIETRPGGGRVIRMMPHGSSERDEIVAILQSAATADLLVAREAVETAIVELACSQASEDDLQAIEEILRKQEAEMRAGGIPHGDLFHGAAADACRNPVLGSIRLELSLHIPRKSDGGAAVAPEWVANRHRQHVAIYEAIRARDPGRARQALLENLREAREYLGSPVKDSQPKPVHPVEPRVTTKSGHGR